MNDAIALNKRLTDLRNEVKNAYADGDNDKGMRLTGQIEMLQDQLTEALDSMRAEDANKNPMPVDPKPINKWTPRTVADGLLGPRDQFHGLARGSKFVYMNEGEATASGSGSTTPVLLPTPLIEEQNIPGTFLEQTGFLSTIASGMTAGDIKYYVSNDPLTAGMWKPGDKKLEQTLSWTQKTCHVEEIAHWIPVYKTTLQDYSQLQSLINNELMLGYERKKDAVAVRGDNTDGIVGILNVEGIQEYKAKSGETTVDSIKRMITASVMTSGIYPNTICLAPEALDDIALMKATDGSYLNLMVNGGLWGLKIAEDVNFKNESGKQDILVYNGSSATFYTQHGVTLEYGTINEQFVYNETSILVEGSHALKVTYPNNFVHMTV